MTGATIRGIQELQDANIKAIALFEPGDQLQAGIKDALIGLHRYLVAITHVDTGAYRASHRIELEFASGRIFVDPSAVNPRSRQLVIDYASEEEARGGSHAAYQRTVSERGNEALQGLTRYLQVEFERIY